MWIFDFLTIILIVLKMTGVVTWSLIAALSPMIVGIVLYTLIKIHLMPRG